MKINVVKPLFASLLMMVLLAACDANTTDEELSNPELAQLSAAIGDEVSLTGSQEDDLRSSFARHGQGRDREPGFLWQVAADLQETLTDEQKEELFNGTEVSEEGLSFRGLLGFPGAGGFYGLGGFMGCSARFGISSLEDELALTDDQQAALEEIYSRYREEFKTLAESYENGSLTEDDVVSELIALREAKEAEILEVLTDEQEAAMEAYRAEREAEFEAFREEVNAVRNEVLGLTSDQAEAYDALFEDQLEARESLIEQLQAGSLTVADFNAEIEALEVAREAVLAGFLDDLQYEIVQIHDALIVRSGRFGHRGGRDFGRKPGGGHTYGG